MSGVEVDKDPVVEVKAPITDLNTRLQAESLSETSCESYCDDEMDKSAVKKQELEAEVAKHFSAALQDAGERQGNHGQDGLRSMSQTARR